MKKSMFLLSLFLVFLSSSVSADFTDVVSSLWTTISSMWSWMFSFFSSLWSIMSWLISIIQAIFYWLTTLISKVWNLALQILDWWVFVNVGRAFEQISYYMWWPATVLIATMLFLVIVRIVIAFVFKIFSLNIDYHTISSSTEKWALEDFKSGRSI